MSYYEIHDTFLNKKNPFIIHYDKANACLNSHWHDSIELLYFTKNRGHVILNADKYEVSPGDIVIVNSNTLHQIEGTDGFVEYFCMIVSLEFLKENGLYTESTIINPIICKDKKAQHIFDKIILEFESHDKLSNTAAIAHIITLFVYLIRNYTEIAYENSFSTASKNKTIMIRKALRYIHSNYTNKLSVQEIADNVNFSKDYLCHSFKEITGHTIVYYINLLRCRYAETLLSQGKMSVSAVATESGFESLSYFTRTYKKLMGTLPSSAD